MSQIIAIANQKGGVAKSTTAQALGSGLSLRGFRVLCIDLDSQTNLSYAMQSSPSSRTSYDLLMGRADVSQIIQHTPHGDFIPAGDELSSADMELNKTGKEYRLKEALEPIRANYDFIVIDTPPALGIITVNALTAATNLIIPAQAEVFSLQGIGQLSNTIQAVRKYCNPALKIIGILLTRHSTRTILSRDMADLIREAAEQLGTGVFNTIIREGVAIKEAQASQQSIFDYAPKSKPAKDYNNFITEYLERSGTI